VLKPDKNVSPVVYFSKEIKFYVEHSHFWELLVPIYYHCMATFPEKLNEIISPLPFRDLFLVAARHHAAYALSSVASIRCIALQYFIVPCLEHL
jgi:hypothetical protein